MARIRFASPKGQNSGTNEKDQEREKHARRQSRYQIMLLHRESNVQNLYSEAEALPLQLLILRIRDGREREVRVPDRGTAGRAVEPRAEQERPAGEVVDAGRLERHGDLHGPSDIEHFPCLFPLFEDAKTIGIT